ncbi:MAG: UDP-N-acetylmuramoyl-L-alanyl-D-glutamate--2,6-diaminopimelate ligase [Flavobacteriales bacterium]|nr:UDP-N-acetylmuramoyl-L-alanyl-D-glutamate--2,6-diaminopimelate ligase [Flavobacteriales bacterium]
MKELNDILKNIKTSDFSAIDSVSVTSVEYDSRKVGEGSIFVAINGGTVDGHRYISKSIELGAKVIVFEQDDVDTNIQGVTFIKVNDTKEALGIIASNFYGNPSSKLKLIGVTGTNGKTTIATQLYTLFGLLSYKVGLFSTIKILAGDEEIVSTNTTPDPVTLNKYLNQMLDAGVTHCFMEVSSHGIDQRRIAGLEFVGGVFTNITRDHLDYHKTFREYLNVKKRFFDELPKSAFAISNSDDKNGLVMMQNTKAKRLTYSMKSVSDFKVKLIESHFNGMLLSIDNKEIWTKLIGKFNAYNLLAIYAVAIELGEDTDEVLTAISKLESVTGRFDHFLSKTGVITVIDYAHTPDALKNVLETINDIRTGNEKLITVVGCGGDRDKGKRPEMAKISCELSNKVILTSDNPRTEKPEDIIADMEAGVHAKYYHKTVSIVDREQGIKSACQDANTGDIILIAGKGHETYQDIMGVKHDFDDFEKAKKILTLLSK